MNEPDEYVGYGEAQIKHLEFIQAVISRLGANGFAVKGWAITVAGAFLGFAVSSEDSGLALVSAVPTSVFWALDAYFLRSERLFRELYEDVRKPEINVKPFQMAATSPDYLKDLETRGSDAGSVWRAARRPTVWPFYVALLGAAGLVALLIC